MTLTDESPMPFGQYTGVAMKDVPAKYLLWMWDEGLHDAHALHEGSARDGVHAYIRDNFSTLETECPDLIIKHRP